MPSLRCVGLVVMLIISAVGLLDMDGHSVAARSAQAQGEDGRIIINGDDNFTAENGVSSGNGTYLNPYVIENMKVNSSGVGGGIYLQFTTAFFVIRNVTVTSGLIVLDETSTGASFTGTDGINLRTVHNGLIENCTFTGNSDGISVLWSCSNILIQNNVISGNLRGIEVESSSFITIVDNHVSQNLGDNVDVLQGSYCTITNNTMVAPGKWGSMSVNLYDSDHCELHGNIIGLGQKLGVNVGFCEDCSVTNNTIIGSTVGVTVYGAERVTYLPNRFEGNSIDIQDSDQQNWVPGVVAFALIYTIVPVVVIAVVWLAIRRRRRTQGAAELPRMNTRTRP